MDAAAATVLARVRGRCGELVLRGAAGHFEVIANGVFLMDTRDGRSERLLVRAAADRMPAGGHVLIGGLGVGFSLAAAVEHPRVRRVTVVEREPAVVEWVRGPLAHLCNGALDDGRVRCVEADLADYLAPGPSDPGPCGPGPGPFDQSPFDQSLFDAICLDVDNGPEWTVTDGNRWLYDDAGLAMIRSRLTGGGVLAVWSASAAPAFATRLRARFDEIEVLAVPVPRGEPDTVFVAW